MSKGAGYSRVHLCSALPGIGRVIWSSGLVQSPWEPESVSKASSKAKHRHNPSPPQRNRKCSKAPMWVPVGHLQLPIQSSSPHPAFMSLLQSGVASQLDHCNATSGATSMVQSTRGRSSRRRIRHYWTTAIMETDIGQRRTLEEARYIRVRAQSWNLPEGHMRIAPSFVIVLALRKVPLVASEPSGVSARLGGSSSPRPVALAVRIRNNHATSRAKAPLTWAAKAKGNHAVETDDDMATQPVSGFRPVTPVDDPGCQSPRWGAQVQVLTTLLHAGHSACKFDATTLTGTWHCDNMVLLSYNGTMWATTTPTLRHSNMVTATQCHHVTTPTRGAMLRSSGRRTIRLRDTYIQTDKLDIFDSTESKSDDLDMVLREPGDSDAKYKCYYAATYTVLSPIFYIFSGSRSHGLNTVPSHNDTNAVPLCNNSDTALSHNNTDTALQQHGVSML
ncbi:hypothetical protein EDB89DRAFT_1901972 [Lactarius sanguifluus]|nr:hypothetical protein EDB89DRAFT_1901972 [Lactarius sanguifluus]